MHLFYSDYLWQKGSPKGQGALSASEAASASYAYKIVVDPYRKRYTIEGYTAGRFDRLIYDSLLLDFRHMKPSEQQGWQSETLSQSPKETICLIRDQIDRVLYYETHQFEGFLCRECRISSPHGPTLSIHRLFYTRLQDSFNGVLLYDGNAHLVLAKRYDTHENGTFTDLLEERWDMQDLSFLKRWGMSPNGTLGA